MNRSITRRDALLLAALGTTVLPTLGCSPDDNNAQDRDNSLDDDTSTKNRNDERNEAMRIYYLEIVTTEVDAACQLYSEIHGVKFGSADQSLGSARVAPMTDGGMVGIRAPMHDGEKSVTRAYTLVKNIEAAVAAAKKSGAEIAVPPMVISGHGTCAIYIQGGIEAGLWQI